MINSMLAKSQTFQARPQRIKGITDGYSRRLPWPDRTPA